MKNPSPLMGAPTCAPGPASAVSAMEWRGRVHQRWLPITRTTNVLLAMLLSHSLKKSDLFRAVLAHQDIDSSLGREVWDSVPLLKVKGMAGGN